MGTYVPLYDPAHLAEAPSPDLEAHRFRSPDDVVESFVHLRKVLATVGVRLLDLVVFDPAYHVWSMHELEHPGSPYALIDR